MMIKILNQVYQVIHIHIHIKNYVYAKIVKVNVQVEVIQSLIVLV